jgi:phage-related minor tail protein
MSKGANIAETIKALHTLEQAVGSSFDRLESKVTKTFHSIEKVCNSAFNKVEQKVTKTFNKLEKASDSAFNKVEHKVDKTFNKIEKVCDSSFNKVEHKVAKTFKKIDEACKNTMHEVGDNVAGALDKMSKAGEKSTEATKSKFGKLTETAAKFSESIGKVGSALTEAGEKGTQYFDSAIEAAEASENVEKRLQLTLKNRRNLTDAQAKEQTDAAAKFAKSLATGIGVQHEEIEAIQTKLALNQKVGDKNDYLNQATKLSYDLQAAGFGSAIDNAEKLSTAINNPIKGLKEFTKEGIAFTKQEHDKITHLAKTGHQAEATALLMGKLGKSYGGAAANSATASSKAAVGMHQLQVKIGDQLLPSVNKTSDSFTSKLIPAFTNFIGKHPALVKATAGVFTALTTIGTVCNSISSIFGTVGTVMEAFSAENLAAAGAFLLAWWPVMAIIAAIAAAAYLIYSNWDKIKAFFSKLWDGVKVIISKAWEFIKNIFLNFTPLGLIIKNWDSIKAFFVKLWDGVKVPFRNIISFVTGLGKELYDAGANIIHSIINGITSKITAVTDVVKNIASKIRSFFPFSPAKDGPLQDIHRIKLVETIADNMKPTAMVNAMKKVTGAVFNAASTPAVPSSFGGSSAGSGGQGTNLTIQVNISGNATKETATTIVDEIKKAFPNLMKQYEAQNRRVSFG